MSRRRQLRLACWLLTAVAVTLWWWQRENGTGVPNRAEDPVRLSLTGGVLYQYDADGKRSTTVRTPYAEHRKNGEDHLDQPKVQNLLAHGERRLHADHAVRNSEKNRITLTGNVQGEQDEGSHHYRLRTTRLDYYPENRYAATDAAITLESGNSRTDADGAHWDMNNNHITLKHNVRSSYDPAN